MTLSDIKCRTQKPGEKVKKLLDGGGIQLWIFPTGSRLWRRAWLRRQLEASRLLRVKCHASGRVCHSKSLSSGQSGRGARI